MEGVLRRWFRYVNSDVLSRIAFLVMVALQDFIYIFLAGGGRVIETFFISCKHTTYHHSITRARTGCWVLAVVKSAAPLDGLEYHAKELISAPFFAPNVDYAYSRSPYLPLYRVGHPIVWTFVVHVANKVCVLAGR